MSGWKTQSSEEIYKNHWIRVRRDKILNHTGKPLTYSVVELNHPSVSIVATDNQGRILLQRHYRYPLDETTWGLPSGHSDGEDLLAAAKRELTEEAGMESNEWIDLGRLYSAVGIGNIPYQVFWAKRVRPGTGERDNEEQVDGHKFCSLQEIEEMILNGDFKEGGVVSILYLAKLRGL